MSKILDIAHDMARDLFEVGAIDEITMREMESLCLRPKRSFDPKEIKRIRTKTMSVRLSLLHFLVQAKRPFSSGSKG